jgi:hypothetical protein
VVDAHVLRLARRQNEHSVRGVAQGSETLRLGTVLRSDEVSVLPPDSQVVLSCDSRKENQQMVRKEKLVSFQPPMEQ